MNRWTLKTAKLLSSSPSRKSALRRGTWKPNQWVEKLDDWFAKVEWKASGSLRTSISDRNFHESRKRGPQKRGPQSMSVSTMRGRYWNSVSAFSLILCSGESVEADIQTVDTEFPYRVPIVDRGMIAVPLFLPTPFPILRFHAQPPPNRQQNNNGWCIPCRWKLLPEVFLGMLYAKKTEHIPVLWGAPNTSGNFCLLIPTDWGRVCLLIFRYLGVPEYFR